MDSLLDFSGGKAQVMHLSHCNIRDGRVHG